MFKNSNLLAAALTGSAAKGYADNFSDIDIILIYKNPVNNEEFDQIVKGAKDSGGDLYHGTPEEGFAVYYYIDGIKCDFGFGYSGETEKLFNEAIAENNEPIDLLKHLQISGFIDGIILYDENFLNPLVEKVKNMPDSLRQKLVKQHLKFLPKWAAEKMAVERMDIFFYYENILEALSNMTGILCGLNGFYHPGKLKGAEFTIEKMKIKPADFILRSKNIFKLEGNEATKELYKLINEVINLIDKYLPAVSTERTREIQKMVLRK